MPSITLRFLPDPSSVNFGGTVVGVGTPEDIAANPDSHTGRYLQRLLG
jgi:excinuclease ABC subunit A